MKKIIALYLILSSCIFASVTIENSEINFQDFEVEYYIDDSKKMDFEKIKRKKFLSAPNEKSFSHNDTHLWIKIKVKNQSRKKQKLFLHHHNAYRLKFIKFYETKDNKLLKYFDMNMSDTQNTQQMYGTDAIYKFTLDSNETKSIYLQATSFVYQYYSLMLFDEKHSAQYLALGHFPIILILGILVGLMIYHFILYLMTFFTDYLYYSLYLFFNILWGSYEYGLMGKYLGWYGEIYATLHFIILFSIIFLGLFIKSVLQMPRLYPIENKFMNIIIILLVINLGYVWIDIYQILFVIIIFLNIGAVIYIGIIISLYRKKAELVSYVIIAQIWLLIFGYIGLSFYHGFSNYNFLTRYSYILGILLDTFAFSYLLSHRIKLLQAENKRIIHQTKRLKALSELLENISHQWRQPLTRINSSVMHIAIQLKRNKINNPKIEKKLDDIENLSVYLSQTIDDFKSLYRKDREMIQFNLYDSIQSSLNLIELDYQKNNIEVHIDIDKNFYVEGYLNEFKQVLQVILHNAKDALISHQTKSPHVDIFAYKKDKYITLEISNNGGEIEENIMEKMFDAHFTTKKHGEGIGLFMSQKILKELMKTSLTCKNINKGVCFKIIFK